MRRAGGGYTEVQLVLRDSITGVSNHRNVVIRLYIEFSLWSAWMKEDVN